MRKGDPSIYRNCPLGVNGFRENHGISHGLASISRNIRRNLTAQIILE